jgi:hypothetical protein
MWAESPVGHLRLEATRPRGRKDTTMPRYLIERTFADSLRFPIDGTGRKAAAGIIARNIEQDVTWVHSYVTADDQKTWCVYDGPSPEAIRAAAERNGLPVDSITEVQVLDPYFYGGNS